MISALPLQTPVKKVRGNAMVLVDLVKKITVPFSLLLDLDHTH